jgi:hypothetical protein
MNKALATAHGSTHGLRTLDCQIVKKNKEAAPPIDEDFFVMTPRLEMSDWRRSITRGGFKTLSLADPLISRTPTPSRRGI